MKLRPPPRFLFFWAGAFLVLLRPEWFLMLGLMLWETVFWIGVLLFLGLLYGALVSPPAFMLIVVALIDIATRWFGRK